MRLLLIFLNEPIPGQVKTELASAVGHNEATRYYKALVEVLLKQLHGLNQTRIRFCYAPNDADDAIRFWLLPLMNATAGTGQNNNSGIFLAPISPAATKNSQEVDFHAQGEGDLGERLNRAFSQGFADGYQEIAVIGTDCPDCGARWINSAFARLSGSTQRDAVIGPSASGAYYILALKSHTPEIFANIPWSSSAAFTTTLKAAESAKLTMESLPPLPDVHDIDDWHSVMKSPLGAALKKSLGDSEQK